MALQVYLALIEALLLAGQTERKPGQRLMELCQWHAQSWDRDAELVACIRRELRKQARLAGKMKKGVRPEGRIWHA